jgi:hypothetical protein
MAAQAARAAASGSSGLTGCRMLMLRRMAMKKGSVQAWQRSQWLTSWW